MNKIIITGRSNVGKSSIIRKITGKKVKIGKRPGVTKEFQNIKLGRNLELVDLPGFGYISGASKQAQEEKKNKIIQYLENKSKSIIFAIQVVNINVFLEIVERWKNRNQISMEVELYSFLKELNLNPIFVANKIDKLRSDEIDETLDRICIELGLDPPWKQWPDIIVPTSAKTGKGINRLKKKIRKRIKDTGKEELLRYI